MAANWSEIPEELVCLVVERLVSVDDIVRFGAVCMPWRRSVSILKKEHPLAPIIMLAKSENDDNVKGTRSLIIPQDKMRRLDVELPNAQGRRCWGSTYGWVVTIGLDFNIHLLNPLTGVQIPLPPQPSLQQLSTVALPKDLTPEHTIRVFTTKFIVGQNSSSHQGELIVMAIFGQHYEVAFTRVIPENEIEAAASSSSWTLVESDSNNIADVIFLEGQIFMINIKGGLSVCDINQTPPKAIQIANPPEDSSSCRRFYLVQVCGCLHLVVRYFDCVIGSLDFYYKTKGFLIYSLNSEENKWDDEYDIQEYALFVGNHTSFALSTTTYPEFSSNSIYFTADHFSGYGRNYCDMGVFNNEDLSIEEFDFTNHGQFSKFSRPIFFMPAF